MKRLPLLATYVVVFTRAAQVGAQVLDARQLESVGWTTRAAAFTRANARPATWQTPSGRSALFALLAREDSVVIATLVRSGGARGASDEFGEEYSEYMVDVLEACVRFCDKQRLMAHLVAQAASDISSVRFDGLHVLGDVADRGFDEKQRGMADTALVHAARDQRSWFIREGAVGALTARMTRDKALSAGARNRLHAAIVAATEDPETLVRITAVQGLGEIKDPGDLPLLQRLAAQDSTIRKHVLRAIAQLQSAP